MVVLGVRGAGGPGKGGRGGGVRGGRTGGRVQGAWWCNCPATNCNPLRTSATLTTMSEVLAGAPTATSSCEVARLKRRCFSLSVRVSVMVRAGGVPGRETVPGTLQELRVVGGKTSLSQLKNEDAAEIETF